MIKISLAFGVLVGKNSLSHTFTLALMNYKDYLSLFSDVVKFSSINVEHNKQMNDNENDCYLWL